MTRKKIVAFWFRRDLRLHDNNGLFQALQICRQQNALFFPLFIFDQNILKSLRSDDARVSFIYKVISEMRLELKKHNIDLNVFNGTPQDVFTDLVKTYDIQQLVANHDYEPYARKRDGAIGKWAQKNGFAFTTFKDQVIFEKQEIQTDAQKPYTVFTAYKNKWLSNLTERSLKKYEIDFTGIKTVNSEMTVLSLSDLGFTKSSIEFPDDQTDDKIIRNYAENRNFPALDHGTSLLGVHLRFGTLSTRELVKRAQKLSDVWLSELIWREFFMQILWNFPHVEKQSFRPQYDDIKWRNDKNDFARWKNGETGYPFVDAGIRELISTGHMHNRVRMVTASFLTKHLLQHWSYGERFFAEHLLDYDLAANNGNWQWAAGTGCDAAPYFRVFNPEAQAEKFDPDRTYIKKWIPEFGSKKYPEPIVDHKFARIRCLQVFKEGLGKADKALVEGDYE